MRPLPSLRNWLQSSSLLAVVAGYTLLLVINSSFADAQRHRDHRQLVEALSLEVKDSLPSAGTSKALGLQLTLLPRGPEQLIRRRGDPSGEIWMQSRRRLVMPDGTPQWLEVRQNITASMQRQRINQMLLVAAAGGSCLFTSLLLRAVLRRGLVQPLAQLSDELTSLEADSLGERLLAVQNQSLELQPIAVAFNGLQKRLAAAWQRERAFVDGVAHELRTPITVISGHAQRLQEAELAPAVARRIGLIGSEAERMGQLVRVLLDIARSDSGRLRLTLQVLDADELLLVAFERLSPLAPDRLQLTAPCLDPLPRIRGDRDRIQQCLAALVDNALRYSTGVVQLRADASAGVVVLHVQDHGPGIPAAERAQVVQRFVRGSSSTGTRGSGIGLATVNLLIEAMDGSLLIAETAPGGADLQLRFRPWAAPPAP